MAEHHPLPSFCRNRSQRKIDTILPYFRKDGQGKERREANAFNGCLGFNARVPICVLFSCVCHSRSENGALLTIYIEGKPVYSPRVRRQIENGREKKRAANVLENKRRPCIFRTNVSGGLPRCIYFLCFLLQKDLSFSRSIGNNTEILHAALLQMHVIIIFSI